MSDYRESLPSHNSDLPSSSAPSWLDTFIAAIAETQPASRRQGSTSTTGTERNHYLDGDLRKGQLRSGNNLLPPEIERLPSGINKAMAPLRLNSSHDKAITKKSKSTTPNPKPGIIKSETSTFKSRPSGRKNKKEEDRIRDLSKDPEVAFFTPYGVVHSKCWMYVQTDGRRKFYKGFFEKHANLCDGSGNGFRLQANYMDDASEVYRGGYRGPIHERFTDLERKAIYFR